MHLTANGNTCSQIELCSIGPTLNGVFSEELKQCLMEAKNGSRKSVIANLVAHQNDSYGEQMIEAGFRLVGRYYGNSNAWVYVYIHGLEAPAAKKPKIGIRKLVRKAISR